MFALQGRAAKSQGGNSGKRSAGLRQVSPPRALRAQRADCACGGACPRCREGHPLLAKLEVSQTGDTLEREADRVAEQVLRMPQPPHPDIPPAPEGARSRGSHRPSGEPLDPATRAFMEPRFGRDLSMVRVHADASAADSARSHSALAYTVGRDVVFGAGQYQPETAAGRRLLAHELAHVVHGIPTRIQRQPVAPAEEPALQAARLRAIGQIRAHIPVLMEALSNGYLFGVEWGPVEEPVSGGVRTNFGLVGLSGSYEISPIEETFAEREARMRTLMSDLARLSAVLESGPMPTGWFNAVRPAEVCPSIDLDNLRYRTGASLNDDLNILYGCYASRIGRSDVDSFMNEVFLLNHPIRTSVAPRRPVARGTDTGIYLLVRDPVHAPMQYERLTGFQGWQPRGAVVVTVWQDAAGYFYYRHGERFYLPERP